ncbi:MAG: DUF1559 domain-containing protein [Aureliella sp.]
MALLIPSIGTARQAARRMHCSNNLKQISLAMLNYEAVYKKLPPAYTTDADGRRLHSWRTLLLPYLEQKALYDSIDLSKPWNDPVNQQAAQTVLPVYTCPVSRPDAANKTDYQVIVDPSSLFPGDKALSLRDVTDGLSNTVMIVEAPDAMAVPWMSPEDCELAEFLSLTEGNHSGGLQVALADGSVYFIPKSVDASTREAMATRQGGEMIDARDAIEAPKR